MGTTKNAQKQAKAELDTKLELARPDRQILEDLAIACAKSPSQDTTCQDAFCLSKSSERSELRYAMQILDGLVKEGYEHQVDCMYGSACALYLLGEYEKARVCFRMRFSLILFIFVVHTLSIYLAIVNEIAYFLPVATFLELFAHRKINVSCFILF
jgi:hypothetical protein